MRKALKGWRHGGVKSREHHTSGPRLEDRERDTGQRNTTVVVALLFPMRTWRCFVQPAIVWFTRARPLQTFLGIYVVIYVSTVVLLL